jgi:hypothetical protein
MEQVGSQNDITLLGIKVGHVAHMRVHPEHFLQQQHSWS